MLRESNFRDFFGGLNKITAEADSREKAEQILSDAKRRHGRLESGIQNMPGDVADAVLPLGMAFDEVYTKMQGVAQSLSEPDADVASGIEELIKLSDVLKHTEKQINDVAGFEDTVPSVEEATPGPAVTEPAPDKVTIPVTEVPAPKVTPATTPKQTPLRNSAVKNALVTQLTAADSFDFLLAEAPEGQRRSKKRLVDLGVDIKTVFEAEHIRAADAEAFFSDTGAFGVQRNEIRSLVGLVNQETDNAKKSEYLEKINEAYIQIRNEALALVMSARADQESQQGDPDSVQTPLERDIETIQADIDTARYAFDTMAAKHMADSSFAASAEYQTVLEAFQQIDEHTDVDSGTYNKTLQTHLDNIWPALKVLEQKFASTAVISDADVEKLDLNTVGAAPAADAETEGLSPAEFLNMVEVKEFGTGRKTDETPLDIDLEALEKNGVKKLSLADKVDRPLDVDLSKLEAEGPPIDLSKVPKPKNAINPERLTERREQDSFVTPNSDEELLQVEDFLRGVEVTHYLPTKDIEPDRLVERKEQGEASLEAKQEFRDVKKRYHKALAVYQAEIKNRKLFSKLYHLGMKPELPESLQALESEYYERRAVYAEELDARLSQRSEKFTLSQDDMKRSFARKFILKPQEELLELQKNDFLTPEAMNRWQKIMAGVKKRKWLIRFGSVALAGAAGAATGGTALAFAGAASLQGAKIAGAIGFGTYAGTVANTRSEQYVQKRKNELTDVQKTIGNEFSLESIAGKGALDAKGEAALRAVTKAEKFQKGVTIAAGGIAGLAAGGEIADAGESFGQLGQPASSLRSEDVSANLQTSKLGPAGAETTELPARPVFLDSVELKIGAVDGKPEYEHHLNKITFGPEFNPNALSEVESKELSRFLYLKAADFLAPLPNMPEATLEAELLAAVEKKFGGASWWAESPVKSIDIGGMRLIDVSAADSEMHRVKEGESLSKITAKAFAEQLEAVPEDKRGTLLSELFTKIQADANLRESVGVKSGNVDLIFPDDKINLDVIEGELANLIEQKQTLENPKTGSLTVEADADTQSVSISAGEKPAAGGTDVEINNEPSYTEAAPTKPEVTTPKSYYETAPQHVRDEIRQYFNNPKQFAAAVDNAAYKIDATQIDIFDRISDKYKSAYEFLAKKPFSELKIEPTEKFLGELKAAGVKYEAYIEWKDKISEIKDIPHTNTTTLRDVFAQSVLLDKINEKNNSYVNP